MDAPIPLSPEELERYARHIVLPEIGGAGQQKLKRARVLIIGAGGLGAPMLQYLAAAGVGTLGIVDDDTVSLSNLQRQVIHDTASIGKSKLDSARAAIERINPNVSVELHNQRLDTGNAAALVAQYDVVADGSDNFETRYAVADACAARASAAGACLGRTFRRPAHRAQALRDRSRRTGRTRPIAICFPSRRLKVLCLPARRPACLARSRAFIGTLQAMEVIKLITGIGEPLVGRLLLYDALAARFDTIRYRARG